MTVSSPVNSVTYTGNNATTIFSYNFEIRVAENAVVILTDITDPSDPIAVELVAAQYTLTGVGDENGGTVTYPLVGSPITTNQRITIQSIEPFTQEVDLVNQDGFYPEVVEGALDKLTRMCQQLDEQFSRALLVPIGSTQDVNLSELIDAINTAAAALAGATGILTPCTATGTNTIALTPVSGGAHAAYINQELFSFVAVNTTSGVVTANVSGLGAKKIYLETGVQASTGDIISGVLYLMSYVAALDSAAGGFYLFGTGPVTLARLPTQAAETFLGRKVGAATGVPQVLTATEARAIIATTLNLLPRGHISGFNVANDTVDATNDFIFSAGATRDDVNAIDISFTGPYTKKLDTAWSLGDGGGLLDTGVVGNNTYHLYAIIRSDTGVVDFVASLGSGGPSVMPASYTHYRRIGSRIRVAGVNLKILQDGDDCWLETPVLGTVVTNPGTTAVSRTVTTPAGIKTVARVAVVWTPGSNGAYGLLSSLDQADVAPSNTVYNFAGFGAATLIVPATLQIRTSTASTIRTRVSASGAADVISISSLGWTDRRGKEG